MVVNKRGVIIIIFVVVILLTILKISLHNNSENSQEKAEIMKISMAWGPQSTYYCILEDDASLICYDGRQSGESIKADNFLTSFIESGEKKLSASDNQYVIGLLEDLKQNPPKDDRIALDSWYITILYDDEIYKADYLLNQVFKDSEPFGKIIDVIVELAPIDIDIIGWPSSKKIIKRRNLL
jgi:hypothetical protein